MKKAVFRLLAITAYAFSIGVFGCYLAMELSPGCTASSGGKTIVFCFGCAGIYFGSLFLGKTVHEKIRKRLMTLSLSFFFMLYLFLVLALTLFDRAQGRPLFASWNSGSCNVIPFRTVSAYILGFYNGNISTLLFIRNILGNLVAFMPFAFFLPLLFACIRNRKRFLISITAIVVLIELLQLVLGVGACDIDDVILNVGGAWILYEILSIPKIRTIIKKMTLR